MVSHGTESLRNPWMQEVTTGIREKGNNMKEWRMKIKLKSQKYMKTSTLCM